MKLLAHGISALIPGWNERAFSEADFYRICDRFGIRVDELSLNVDGFYYRAAGNDLIAVNSRLGPEMKLRVLLHELGHFLLHAPGSGAAAGFHNIGSRTRQEAEADAFAACALIPRPLVEAKSVEELEAEGYSHELICDRVTLLRDHGI